MLSDTYSTGELNIVKCDSLSNLIVIVCVCVIVRESTVFRNYVPYSFNLCSYIHLYNVYFSYLFKKKTTHLSNANSIYLFSICCNVEVKILNRKEHKDVFLMVVFVEFP